MALAFRSMEVRDFYPDEEFSMQIDPNTSHVKLNPQTKTAEWQFMFFCKFNLFEYN